MNLIEGLQVLFIIPVIMVSFLYPVMLNTKLSGIIISPVVIFSLYLLFQHDAPSLLLLPQGLLGGIVLFTLSVWFIERRSIFTLFKEYISNIRAFFRIGLKQFQGWLYILSTTAMVIYEELVWRVFLVESLGLYLYPGIVVITASFLFYYSHAAQRNFSKQSVDLFIFSLALTSLYFFTESFVLVVLIHWIRNMIIIINSVGEQQNKTKLATSE